MERTVPAMPATHGCCKDKFYMLYDAVRMPRPDPVRKDQCLRLERNLEHGVGVEGPNVSAA